MENKHHEKLQQLVAQTWKESKEWKGGWADTQSLLKAFREQFFEIWENYRTDIPETTYHQRQWAFAAKEFNLETLNFEEELNNLTAVSKVRSDFFEFMFQIEKKLGSSNQDLKKLKHFSSNQEYAFNLSPIMHPLYTPTEEEKLVSHTLKTVAGLIEKAQDSTTIQEWFKQYMAVEDYLYQTILTHPYSIRQSSYSPKTKLNQLYQQMIYSMPHALRASFDLNEPTEKQPNPPYKKFLELPEKTAEKINHSIADWTRKAQLKIYLWQYSDFIKPLTEHRFSVPTKHADRPIEQVVFEKSQSLCSQFGLRGIELSGIPPNLRLSYLQTLQQSCENVCKKINLPFEHFGLKGTLTLGRQPLNQGDNFNSGTGMINLTYPHSETILLHEWGHALDHHIADGYFQGQIPRHLASESKLTLPHRPEHPYHQAFHAIGELMVELNTHRPEQWKAQTEKQIQKIMHQSWASLIGFEWYCWSDEKRSLLDTPSHREALLSWINAPSRFEASLAIQPVIHRLTQTDLGLKSSPKEYFSEETRLHQQEKINKPLQLLLSSNSPYHSSNAFLTFSKKRDSRLDPWWKTWQQKPVDVEQMDLSQTPHPRTYWSSPGEMFARAIEANFYPASVASRAKRMDYLSSLTPTRTVGDRLQSMINSVFSTPHQNAHHSLASSELHEQALDHMKSSLFAKRHATPMEQRQPIAHSSPRMPSL